MSAPRKAMSLPFYFTTMKRQEMIYSASTSTIKVSIKNITLRST